MKRICAPLTFAVLLCAFSGRATSNISGDIHDMVFSAENNPYIVEKDIVVPEGKEIEIPAGCVFLFKAFTGLLVHGQIKVVGAPGASIVFSSIHDSEFNPASTQLPNPFDWNGILVSNSSVGSYFNNFSLRYSVYGIKSQSQNVLIQNGIFRQNGQFHFTIHDKIQFVQDNIPYSYGAKINSRENDNSVTVGAGDPAKKKHSKGGRTSRQTKIVRFTCLGVGIVCTGVGTAFAIRGSGRTNELNDWNYDDRSNEDWRNTEDERKQSIVGASVCYGIGLLSFIGFGITFAF